MKGVAPIAIALTAWLPPAWSQHAEHAPPDTHASQDAHAEHGPATDHAADHTGPADVALPREPIPTLTDADRAAASAPAGGHARHDSHWNGLLTIDRLESWNADGPAFGWEADAWVGTDLTRLLLKTEGTRSDGDTEHASVEVLASRALSTWWDVVAGLRHDFGGPSHRDYAALGVQGLAPWWLHVAATAYAGSDSRSAARVEVEHDLLLTNRLILQSHVQADLTGKDDAVNAVAAGLSTFEFGLRLRFEITRRFAPYAGLGIERAVGDTARLRRALGTEVRDTRLVFGLRTWF